MPVALRSIRLNWMLPVKPAMPVTLPVMSLASASVPPPITPLPLTPTMLPEMVWFWISPSSSTPVALFSMVLTPDPAVKPKPPEALSTSAATPTTLSSIRLPASAAEAA